VPALVLCLGVFFINESPRFLFEKELYDEARKVLKNLHDDRTNDEFLDLEFREIKDAILADHLASRHT
jgi:hypothetical protein